MGALRREIDMTVVFEGKMGEEEGSRGRGGGKEQESRKEYEKRLGSGVCEGGIKKEGD